MSESEIVTDVRLALSRDNIRLFRNNVGRYKTPYGTYIQYGLCVGSSDLIGFKSIKITSDMVGLRIAQFVAMEAKDPGNKGRVTNEQQAFIRMVQEHGGIAGVFRSLWAAKNLLGVDTGKEGAV